MDDLATRGRPGRAVILLSGGLDSATTVAVARHFGAEVHTLTVAYGQRQTLEIERAEALAQAMGVASHRTIEVPLHAFGGSRLVDGSEAFEAPEGSSIPSTYVPARNTILLSLGMGLGEAVGAGWLLFGANAIDFSGYPDCRPDYVDAMNTVARLATRQGREGPWPLRIEAPLLYCTKARIVRLAVELDLDLSLTASCYFPTDDGRACGTCDSCRLRLEAFRAAGVPDPIPYVEGAR